MAAREDTFKQVFDDARREGWRVGVQVQGGHIRMVISRGGKAHHSSTITDIDQLDLCATQIAAHLREAAA